MPKSNRLFSPLISVIIPTYNRVAFLARAVESVLGQSFADFELLVVDDGSTDETNSVLAQFSDTRLKILRQENKGVSAARNVGLRAAKGDFFALLDSDDFWEKEKLGRQIAFMKESGFHICQTGEKWIRGGKTVNPRHIHEKKAGWILPEAVKLCLVSPSCVMFSRYFLRQVGFFCEDLPACEDYELWLRASLLFPVGFVPQALVVKYGGHSDQLSRKTIGLDLYRIYALLRVLKLAKTQEQKNILRTALQEKVRVYFLGCMKNGNFEEARRIQELVKSVFCTKKAPEKSSAFYKMKSGKN